MSQGIKISISGIRYKFPHTPLDSFNLKSYLLYATGKTEYSGFDSLLPELFLPTCTPENILARCKDAHLPFTERISGFMQSGCEKVIVNCMNGFHVDDTEKLINGTKILLIALKVRSAVFALDSSDKASRDALSLITPNNRMFSTVNLPSLFPVANNRLLSLCMYPYTKRKAVAVFSPHELVALFNATVAGEVYHGHIIRLAYGDKYLDTFITRGCTVSDILSFASKCFGNELSWVKDGLSGLGRELEGDSLIPDDISAFSVGKDRSEKRNCACSGCAVCREVCPFSIRPDLLMLSGKSNSDELERCVLCGLCDEFCPSGIEISKKISSIKTHPLQEDVSNG